MSRVLLVALFMSVSFGWVYGAGTTEGDFKFPSRSESQVLLGPGVVFVRGEQVAALSMVGTFRAIDEVPVYAGLELGLRTDLDSLGMHGYGVIQYFLDELGTASVRPYVSFLAGWSLLNSNSDFDWYLVPGAKVPVFDGISAQIELRTGLSDAAFAMWPHIQVALPM